MADEKEIRSRGSRRSGWLRILLTVLGGLLTATALAAGALALTFTPARLDPPAADVGPLPPAQPPASLSISAISTGTYENPAMFAYRGGGLNDIRQFASDAVLIRHPRGNLLIDTGFGRKLEDHMKLLPAIQQAKHVRKTTARAALERAGLSPGDISGIVPTHVHWDHISGVQDLAGVPVLVTADARRFIDSHAKGTEVINSFATPDYRLYAFEDGPYLGFPRSHDVFGDGSVVIVPAPGHTPDSVIVFVALPSGKRYALVGDLVWQREGLEIPAEKPWMLRWLIGEDRQETNTDIGRIREAVRRYPQITAIPAHDVRAMAALPVFPRSQS